MATLSEVKQAIKLTAEVTGSMLSDDAIAMMLMQLKPYGADAVMTALNRCQRELKHRLTLADIVERITQTDGRYTADEAWAKLPKDNRFGELVTAEMDEAAGFAFPLLEIGDKVAARKAFIDAYTRLVDDARASGKPAKWRVSMGVDGGNMEAAADGLRRGLFPLEYVARILNPDDYELAVQRAGIQLALPAPTEKGRQFALEARKLLEQLGGKREAN